MVSLFLRLNSDLTSTDSNLTSTGSDLTSTDSDLTSTDSDLTSTGSHLTSAGSHLTSTGSHLTSTDSGLTSTGSGWFPAPPRQRSSKLPSERSLSTRAVRPRPSSPAKMVVTSRMLAAHTNGYPIDAKARFWSNYYRSLKDITREEPRPRISDTLPKTPTPASHSGPAVYPKSTYPLVLNTISPSVRPSSYL